MLCSLLSFPFSNEGSSFRLVYSGMIKDILNRVMVITFVSIFRALQRLRDLSTPQSKFLAIFLSSIRCICNDKQCNKCM